MIREIFSASSSVGFGGLLAFTTGEDDGRRVRNREDASPWFGWTERGDLLFVLLTGLLSPGHGSRGGLLGRFSTSARKMCGDKKCRFPVPRR